MWSSQALSFVFATHRVYLVLPGCPLSVLWPGNSLQAISWDNCSASFICFNLSGIIILLCLLSCAFQTTVSGILSIWGLVSGGRGNQSLILANSLHLKFKACFYPKKFFLKIYFVELKRIALFFKSKLTTLCNVRAEPHLNINQAVLNHSVCISQ